MKDRIIKALNARSINPMAQRVYNKLVGIYSKNKCVMQALSDLTIWNSGKRGDWKPDLLSFLHHRAREFSGEVWREALYNAARTDNREEVDWLLGSEPAQMSEAEIIEVLMRKGREWFVIHAPGCFPIAPTSAAENTDIDNIRNLVKDMQRLSESQPEDYRPPSTAPEWQNDLSFQMLINGIYIPASFSSNQEKMRCLYNFFRDMVMIEPPMNQNQQRQILNLFMVWSECLGRVG